MTTQKSLYLLILLGIAIFPNINVECRPNYNYNRQLIEQILQPDYLSTSPDQESLQDYYEKLYPLSEIDQNFLTNWPYFRDFLRLKDFTPSPKDTTQYDLISTPQPLQQIPIQPNRNAIKDTAQKKNSNSRRNEYMHACHFKICNMGRKRNVRYDY